MNETEESKTQQPSLFDFSHKQQRDVVIGVSRNAQSNTEAKAQTLCPHHYSKSSA